MYKIVNKKAPGYLIDLFENSNSEYELREQESRLILPSFNTEFSKKKFFFHWGKIWNSIPYNIRSAPTLSAFKIEIRFSQPTLR